jgi:hypothetical protein
MPALPIDEAGKYVAGAYMVFLVLVLIYVAIMAAKLDRMQKDLTELADLAEHRGPGGADATAEQPTGGVLVDG